MYQNQSGVQRLKSMLGIKQTLLVWLNPENLQFYVLLKDPPYQVRIWQGYLNKKIFDILFRTCWKRCAKSKHKIESGPIFLGWKIGLSMPSSRDALTSI